MIVPNSVDVIVTLEEAALREEVCPYGCLSVSAAR